MKDEVLLFGFEEEFAQSLRCIPMTVRFKLDQCFVKLSLRQWARFSADDRFELLTLPCSDEQSTALYRKHVIDLITARTDEPPKDLAEEMAAAWTNPREVPEQLALHAGSMNVEAPTLEQWSALSPLQRYALLKLARNGHENLNFLPAMREFGLLDGGAPAESYATTAEPRVM